VDKDRVPDVGQQLPDGPMQKVDSHQRERIRDQPKTGVPGGNQKFPCLVKTQDEQFLTCILREKMSFCKI
jgi:hypothetical protein